jgi:signal transduction histidine kinase/ActR/RegA family two-component response regulator
MQRQRREVLRESRKLSRALARQEAKIERYRTFVAMSGMMESCRAFERQKLSRYLRFLLMYSRNPILLLDRKGRVVRCGDAFLKAAGLDRSEQAEGRDAFEVFRSILGAEFALRVRRWLHEAETGDKKSAASLRSLSQGREEPCRYEVHITPAFGVDGEFEGAIVLCYDSAGLRRELSAKADVHKASAEVKNHFLAYISHEIRTPVSVITGMGDLMRVDNLDEEQARYFSDIQKTSRSLMRVVNDILELSRIEAGKLPLTLASYDISALFSDVCSFTRFTVRDKPLDFLSSIAHDIPPVLYGDETRLRRAISNILDSALEGIDLERVVGIVSERVEKGRLLLSLTREKHKREECEKGEEGGDFLSIRIEATDGGRGKEKFERISKIAPAGTDTAWADLTGETLGLCLAARLVEMMGGAVTASHGEGGQNQNKTSVFTILLPIREGNPEELERSGDFPHVMVRPGTSVLVTDDNVANLRIAAGYLAKHGIEPDLAKSGEQALKMARAHDYDLVFVDHMMPGMDGIQTAQAIRALGESQDKLPIIMLSANADEGMREFFIQSGLTDYIPKPIEPSKLNDILAAWLPKEQIKPREGTA